VTNPAKRRAVLSLSERTLFKDAVFGGREEPTGSGEKQGI
jgi:hypothetical protein